MESTSHNEDNSFIDHNRLNPVPPVHTDFSTQFWQENNAGVPQISEFDALFDDVRLGDPWNWNLDGEDFLPEEGN
jgi:hypothetical protein